MNGQLPNLDLVNMVNKLTLREGLHPMFKERPLCDPVTCPVLEYGTGFTYPYLRAILCTFQISFDFYYVGTLPVGGRRGLERGKIYAVRVQLEF